MIPAELSADKESVELPFRSRTLKVLRFLDERRGKLVERPGLAVEVWRLDSCSESQSMN